MGVDDLHPKGIKAQRLKSVFNIGIETCTECGGTVKEIVGMPNHCIEDTIVIKKILDHLRQKTVTSEPNPLPESRAPPIGLFT